MCTNFRTGAQIFGPPSIDSRHNKINTFIRNCINLAFVSFQVTVRFAKMSERSKGNNRPTRLNTALLKDRFFSIQIKLLPTGEVFPLKKIHNDMKIFELKNLAEFATGIPVNMQRLYYLDEGISCLFCCMLLYS